jgi:HEAT repeat protein
MRWHAAWLLVGCLLVSCAPGQLSEPTEVPSPTPTPVPLPAVDAILQQYSAEVGPLSEKLEAAHKPQSSFRQPSFVDAQIVLIPLDARLYYVQTLLYPDELPDIPSTQTTAYIAYAYERGEDLHWSWHMAGRDTQQVKVRIRLVADSDGEFLLVEERDGLGGAGSAGYQELIQQAVEPLEALGARAPEIESRLERILGFATGLDWDESLERSRQLALLQWALGSPHWADRVQAAEEIFRLGSVAKETIPALVKALGHEDDYVRGKVVAALVAVEHGAQESIPDLLEALEDENEYTRAGAAQALGAVGGSSGQTGQGAEATALALIQALGDESALVRKEAVSSLGRMGPREGVIPALRGALEDEDPWVRRAAVLSLGLIGPEEGVVPLLCQVLAEEDEWMRQNAALALGFIGSEASEAVPALIQALGDEQEHVREAAAKTLEAITGQNLGEDAQGWQRWWEEQQ